MDLLKASRPLVLLPALLASVLPGRAADGVARIEVRDRTSAYPSLAAIEQFVVLAWGATTKNGVTDIYASASTNGGRTFAPPTRVNGLAGEASLSGEQPPRIALIPRNGRTPTIVVVWTSKGSAGTRLLSARSDDGGKSFAASAPIPGSGAAGNRGWETIATSRSTVVGIWLDHRETATGRSSGTATSHAEHEHKTAGRKPADGVARAQLSKLMFGRLGEPDSTRTLTGGVCYCCKTAIATDDAGGIYAAWRHVYEGNIRDIAFTRSSDGGRTFLPPVRVSSDKWELDGCPENGPAMVVDEAKHVHVVWPTLVSGPTRNSEPTLALFYAMSTDGREFTPRQRIPTEGVARHPQIVLGPGGRLVVAWDEQSRGTRRLAVAGGAISVKGVVRFDRQPIVDGARAEYPALATTSDGTLVAWTSGSAGATALRVQRLMN
jgi:hypothetical protein